MTSEQTTRPAYVLVPVEPTREMQAAGGYHCIRGAGPTEAADMQQAAAVYRAMIARAAPPAPADERLAEIRERLRDAADRVAKRAMGHDTRALISIPRQPTDVDAIIIEAADLIASLQARVGELERERSAGWVGIRINELQSRAEAAEAERDRLSGLLRRARDEMTAHVPDDMCASLFADIRAALKDTTHAE